MRRPLLFFTLAFILGIFFNDKKLGIAFIAILFVLCEISYYLSKNVINYKIKFSQKYIVLFFVFVVLGWLFLWNYNFYKESEVKQYDNFVCEIIGTVGNDGVKKSSYWQYILKNNYISGNSISSKILLKSKEKIEYGDKIKLKGEIEIPKGARNKNTFDYAKYLKTLDIYISAESNDIKILKENDLLIVERISAIVRNKVKEFTSNNLEQRDAGILNALIIGDDALIESSLEEDYKKAGMLHLLVVSGGHTVFLVLLLKGIFSFIKINPNISKFLYIFIIFLYIFITGATASILRAGIGIIIVMIANLIGRQNDAFTTMALVALLLILKNPNTLFSLSFLLSFGGVLGIMICYPKVSKKLEKLPKFISEPLSLTLAAQLFVTPITIYSFNVIYLGGIISNLFTMSLSGILMMAGIIGFILYLLIPPIVRLPMKVVSIFIELMNKIAEIFGSIECLTQYVVTPNFFSIILYYAILLYACIERNNKKTNEKSLVKLKYNWIPIFIRKERKMFFVICGLISILIVNTKIIDFDKSLTISVIDVGHGDSILITTPNNKNILIDTGDKYYYGDEVSDSGEQTIVPYLLKQGIKKIDLLILTHMDSDHIGGYESISKVIDIEQTAISINSAKKDEYPDIKNIAISRGISIKKLKRGDTFKVDGVKINALMPQKNKSIENENNDSIVLLMEYQGKKALFMGDLEAEGEEILLSLEKDLDIDILKVGHHGSITSSTYEFIKETTPEIALISVGNRFKSIPEKAVLDRLSSVYAKIYRTDEVGEINVIIDNGKIKVKTTY